MNTNSISHYFYSNVIKIMLVTSLIVGVIISLFFYTKVTPPTSELAFTEHSIRGKEAGSVIPASCESSPPTNHFSFDCPGVVQVSFRPIQSFISFTQDSNRVLTFGSNKISWSAPGTPSCRMRNTFTRYDGRILSDKIITVPATGSHTVDYYGGVTSGGAIYNQSIHTLTCTYPNGQVINRAARVFHEYFVDPWGPCGPGGCGGD